MNNLEKMSKFILPTAILIGSLALGGFYYAGQVNKQSSIERQQRVKMEDEAEQRDKLEAQKKSNDHLYGICIEDAEDYYWNYMELNGTGKKEEKIEAETRHWETAEENKQQDLDNCFKQYK